MSPVPKGRRRPVPYLKLVHSAEVRHAEDEPERQWNTPFAIVIGAVMLALLAIPAIWVL